MSRLLAPVPDLSPDPTTPAEAHPIGKPPAAGPLDEFSRARIRSLAEAHLDDVETLDAHLALLDTRGAWYAERVLGAWPADQPDTFFGLVRHVVRTQMPGPPPAPDVEGWLAAGRPAGELGEAWDQVAAARQPRAGVRPVPKREKRPDSMTQTMDDTVGAWSERHLATFTLAYCSFEAVLEGVG